MAVHHGIDLQGGQENAEQCPFMKKKMEEEKQKVQAQVENETKEQEEYDE